MNKEQFITYVEGSQSSFRRFLTALCCGDSRLADDIAQESYLKAYLSCDGLNDPDRFKPWLYKIGYNTFLNVRRGERVTVGYDQLRDRADSSRADDSFRYQSLYMALDRLSEKERTSILLFYMEGYSIEEIAAIEGQSRDAVKQLLYRGRNHLRNLINNDTTDYGRQ